MSGIHIDTAIHNGGRLPVANIGTLAQRPPFGIPQQLYFSTDNQTIYYDNGTAWVILLSPGGGGTLTNANNGLSVAGGNTAQMGGPLIKDTDIVANGFRWSLNQTPLPDNSQIDVLIDTIGLSSFGSDITQDFAQIVIQSTPSAILFTIMVGGNSVGCLFNNTTVQLRQLDNADATKFLQAGPTGILANVTPPVIDANNGLSIGTGSDANKVQLGGTLIKDTVIDSDGFAIGINVGAAALNNASLVLQPGEAALSTQGATTDEVTVFELQDNSARIGMYDGATDFDALSLVPLQLALSDVAGVYALLSRLAVTFKALANADATKFLQADGTGNITSVAAPVVTANNGLTVTAGNVQLGGTLLGATVIDTQTNTLLIRSAPAHGTAAGAINLDSNEGSVQWVSGANVPTGFLAGNNLASIQSNGVNVMDLTDTTVKFEALANANATKFLQADASGNITNVAPYNSPASAAYAGTITWTGTPPSGTVNNTYQYGATGKIVNLYIYLNYSVPGVAITNLNVTLPAGMPTPNIPAGFNVNNTTLYSGRMTFLAALGVSTPTPPGNPSAMYFDGTNWNIRAAEISGAYLAVLIYIQYNTA